MVENAICGWLHSVKLRAIFINKQETGFNDIEFTVHFQETYRNCRKVIFWGGALQSVNSIAFFIRTNKAASWIMNSQYMFTKLIEIIEK